MVSFSISDFKPGLKVIIESEPCDILEEEFVKPGKGQAFNKIKFRNLLTGRLGEKTCKVGETLGSADVKEFEMQFLYSDASDWYFLDPKTFEQILITKEQIGSNKNWLTEEAVCKVIFWDNSPISITPPTFVELKVVQTGPGIKGDTVSGGNKLAKLSTGVEIKVPLFISEGDIVKVDSRNGEYQGRK